MEEREYREAQRELNELAVKAEELYASVDIAALKERLKILEQQACTEDIWRTWNARRGPTRDQPLEKKIEPWERLQSAIAEARDLMNMALTESDSAVLEEVAANIPALSKRFDELETLELLSG